MDSQLYDLIIIGAGPAGLTASIYASRYKLNNLLIGRNLGGELSLAHKVENYPGFISVSGIELAEKWKQQVENLGARLLLKEVGKIEKKEEYFLVEISKQEKYLAKTVIVATGSKRRRLNISGEKEFMGKGISYCHTCDAPFFRDKTVALIGGADSAVSGGIHTAEYAKKVYIIYRRDRLRAEPIWIEEWKRIEKAGKGETIYNTNITEILGTLDRRLITEGTEKNRKHRDSVPSAGSVSSVIKGASDVVGGIVLDKPYKGSDILPVDGVFIEIGSVPGTALAQPLGVKIDEAGHIVVNEEMETDIAGLFCAGDMVSKSANFKQAILAMAQGARAAASAFKFIKGQQAPPIRGV